MCSDTTTSPRISYSLDNFGQVIEGIPVQFHQSYQSYPLVFSDSSFEFGVFRGSSLEHELSSADELFGNGTILPAVHHARSLSINSHCELGGEDYNSLQPLPFLSPLYSSPVNVSKAEDHEKGVHQSRSPSSSSFWGFRRSNSVNNSDDVVHGSGNNVSLLLPIPVLPRSRSVSSHSSNKRLSQYKQQPTQQESCAACPIPQRLSAALRKRSYNKNRGTVRVSPVLHVTVPCISKRTGSASFLGCFFLRGNAKDSKKNIA